MRRNPRAKWVLPEVIDPPDRLCFQIEVPNDKFHIAAFKGALYTLTSAVSWADDLDHTAKAVAAVWAEIYDNLRTCTDTPIETENDCIEYLPNSENITFAPADPFSQPGLIPDGYVQPPFVVLDDLTFIDQLLGLQVGDVLTGFLGFPVLTPALGQGLARFRVRVNGTGVVELHFLKLPLGGMVLITEDDNPLSANIVSLYKDPLVLPLEIITEIVIEIEFTTPGEHHIDVSFLARFNDELTFFTYGGGIRSVVLCGFDNMAVDNSIDLGDDDMKLRIRPTDPCIIQNECSPGVWEDWYDPRACIAENAGQTPPQGELIPSECREFSVNLQGNSKYLLPVPVDDGYTIQISAAQGGWWDGNVLHAWNCPNGQTYALGACVSTGEDDPASPIPDLPIGRLIAEIDGVFYDAFNTTISAPGGTGQQNMYFQMNDATLEDNQGSISFNVTVCATPSSEWCHEWLGSQGIGNLQALFGVFAFGNTRIESRHYGSTANDEWATGNINGSGTVTHIEMDTIYQNPDDPGNASVIFFADTVDPANDGGFDSQVVPSGSGTQTFEWDGSEAFSTNLGFFISGRDAAHGRTYITRILIRGTGSNPFTSSNCT